MSDAVTKVVAMDTHIAFIAGYQQIYILDCATGECAPFTDVYFPYCIARHTRDSFLVAGMSMYPASGKLYDISSYNPAAQELTLHASTLYEPAAVGMGPDGKFFYHNFTGLDFTAFSTDATEETVLSVPLDSLKEPGLLYFISAENVFDGGYMYFLFCLYDENGNTVSENIYRAKHDGVCRTDTRRKS